MSNQPTAPRSAAGLPSPEILGMMVSEAVFQLFGFGPSQDICKPFAERVIEEADRLIRAYNVEGTPAGRKGVQILTVAEYVQRRTGQPYVPPHSDYPPDNGALQ
jgi:hypothetical protein